MKKEPILASFLLAGFNKNTFQGIDPSWQYIADMILNSELIIEKSKEPWEFKTIAELGSERFSNLDAGSFIRINQGKHFNYVMADCAEEYCRITSYFAHDHLEGLPLYIKDGENFVRANDTHEDYLFLRLALKRWALEEKWQLKPPSWAETIYVGRKGYEIFKDLQRDTAYLYSDISNRARALRIKAVEFLLAEETGQNVLQLTPNIVPPITPSIGIELARLKYQQPNTKSTNTMLRVIAGMAMAYACKDGIREPRATAQAVSSDLAKLGIDVSDKTLAEYFKRGLDTLN